MKVVFNRPLKIGKVHYRKTQMADLSDELIESDWFVKAMVAAGAISLAAPAPVAKAAPAAKK